ncbi:hypothetical protein F442_22025 [Phytophthora nicotianae P10297]|uniref:Uncharacterized protein n=3 Tax=Phytophthora nicotianae TaxID=4792 RepID=W2PGY2_PHYN3|nr:hypothetical protein PPTG_24442 [Phytophthora nicotianae INRA-310]ETK71146.1 hypothetical protein L915_21550 [Phytophthora nicotianae]ETL24595.1 hypothetical protein L916_21417 [Phytophthora nicotianae]ETM99259.1 hypothetical protein PPTG_24442 [Phytophthora nicotianae INRA-310]ETP28697.1 hypothetical protein F442_22025 [Phytophthora nicotianae P10297]
MRAPVPVPPRCRSFIPRTTTADSPSTVMPSVRTSSVFVDTRRGGIVCASASPTINVVMGSAHAVYHHARVLHVNGRCHTYQVIHSVMGSLCAHYFCLHASARV